MDKHNFLSELKRLNLYVYCASNIKVREDIFWVITRSLSTTASSKSISTRVKKHAQASKKMARNIIRQKAWAAV